MAIQINGTTVIDNSRNLTNLGSAITAAQGGTGLTSPGSSGNVLTSNGTTWTSAAPSGGGGATSKGSIMLWTSSISADALSRSTFETLTSDAPFTKPFKASSFYFNFNSSVNNTRLQSVSYSPYYGCYFGIAIVGSGANVQYPLISADGTGWTNYLSIGNSSFSFVTGVRPVGIGVNESNGNIYVIGSNNYLYYSTDAGFSWTAGQDLGNMSYYPQTGVANMSYRYLNSGTASTSRAAFFYDNGATGWPAVVSLAGNGNPLTGWTGADMHNNTNNNLPYQVTTYGTKAAVVILNGSGSVIYCYEASNNTGANQTTTTLGLPGSGSFERNYNVAITDSYWCAPSSTSGNIRYGTISGTTMTSVGQVTLTDSRSVASCFYDGTRWLAFTMSGLWYSTQANPSSGWTKSTTAGLGIYMANYGDSSAYTNLGMSYYQRDPLR